MINIKIKGLTNILELIIPHMRRYKYGTIFNISSVADRNPRLNCTVYAKVYL